MMRRRPGGRGTGRYYSPRPSKDGDTGVSRGGGLWVASGLDGGGGFWGGVGNCCPHNRKTGDVSSEGWYRLPPIGGAVVLCTKVPWSCGPAVLRSCGPAVLRSRGPAVPRS